MEFPVWSTLVGLLLVSIALIGSFFRHLPLTTTMCYFAVGLILGPLGFGWVRLDVVTHATLLEHLAEIAVIVSLFTTGLKLRLPLRRKFWEVPLRLAFVSMMLTVGMVATTLVVVLGIPWGAGVIIGAVLAPTDPVLASEVQVRHAGDDDPLRFSLTAEAGLNDGTAFPFVMLGLGLLGLHDIGAAGWRWWAVDVAWAITGGLGIGALLGFGAAEFVLYLRRRHREGFGYDEFLALGLIGLSYGTALLAHAYGFLAVFAAGLALRTVERRHTGSDKLPTDVLDIDRPSAQEAVPPEVHPNIAPAQMAESLLAFNLQIERLVEVTLVLCVGAILSPADIPPETWWFVPLLFLVIRPAAVWLGLIGAPASRTDRWMMSWLGIRGIGSVYYLMYAVGHGLSDASSRNVVAMVVVTIAASIVLHGATASALMRFGRRSEQA